MAIEVHSLSKTFRTRPRRASVTVAAVQDLSYSIEQGERIAYIGPNGAGKSTSIKMLTGVLHPSSGSATVLGLTPWKQRRALSRRIGTLFGQRSQLWFELTPRQSFRLLGAIYGLDDSVLWRRVNELGDVLEATELFDHSVRSLSLGQRMRCELAACMLHDPAILFLDEPTIGLDLIAKQNFRELLVRLNGERGTTIFLTSHDVADIEHVARRALIINHGTLIYDDDVATMRTSLLTTKVIDITINELTPAFDIAGVTTVERDTSRARLWVDMTHVAIRDVLAEVVVAPGVGDISVTDPALESVIADIYQRPRQ